MVAAALARGARQREHGTRGDATDVVLAEWHQLVADLRAERDRAVAERDHLVMRLDGAIRQTEDALAERDQARIELRSCRQQLAGGT
ncbi:MAG: hypothetical protein SHS37scaffold145_15 [Phage 71_18]|nr:MAG: hypothetical protein SHS37scaffold145_15 [Phage 71_18]